MQSLSGDQVAHEDEPAGPGPRPGQHFFPGDAAGEVVAPGGATTAAGRSHQTFHFGPGGVAVEDKAVDGSQILLLHPTVQAVLPGGAGSADRK